jgi:small subunit ribosomal protein S6
LEPANLNTPYSKNPCHLFLNHPLTLTFALPYPTGKAFNHFLIKKHRVMNNYELMVIFTPVLSDDEFKAAQKKYAALVSDNGGQVVAENPWGLKSLAYPIQKKTTGLYWVLEFSAPSDFNEKLKIQLLRDESVLRHMITRLDKYAVEYNQKKRSGVPTGTEKLQEG